MRIGFDIDDTITRHPQFFAVLTKALSAAGHEVYIVTFREDQEFAREDLSEYGIKFDELIMPTSQEWEAIGSENWKQKVADWKADACRKLQIDVLFDDMPEVINAVDRQTLRLMVVNPELGNVAYRTGS